MIYVIDLIKTNKSFPEKKLKEVTLTKNYVVREMFGGLKFSVCYLSRRLRLPQLKRP